MSTPVMIENYGYVPFQYFQYVIISLIIVSLFKGKEIYQKLDEKIYSKFQDGTNKLLLKTIISLLPVFIIFYYDSNYKSFSMKNLGVLEIISSDKINILLKLLGSYVVIQVAAQDLGVKTGDNQSDFTKLPIMQYFLYAGAAFSLTQDRSQSLIASLAYFQLKTFASQKIKDVCFD